MSKKFIFSVAVIALTTVGISFAASNKLTFVPAGKIVNHTEGDLNYMPSYSTDFFGYGPSFPAVVPQGYAINYGISAPSYAPDQDEQRVVYAYGTGFCFFKLVYSTSTKKITISVIPGQGSQNCHVENNKDLIIG